VIAILRPGDWFGEHCVAIASLRTSTAATLQPSTIARVSRKDIVRALERTPAFAKLFTFPLLSRFGELEAELMGQMCNPIEERLARILLLLAGFGLQPKAKPVPVKVSQETLVQLAGTARSRAGYFMNRFQNMGLT
jgi:CRP-like cAMP-binding protein